MWDQVVGLLSWAPKQEMLVGQFIPTGASHAPWWGRWWYAVWSVLPGSSVVAQPCPNRKAIVVQLKVMRPKQESYQIWAQQSSWSHQSIGWPTWFKVDIWGSNCTMVTISDKNGAVEDNWWDCLIQWWRLIRITLIHRKQPASLANALELIELSWIESCWNPICKPISTAAQIYSLVRILSVQWWSLAVDTSNWTVLNQVLLE